MTSVINDLVFPWRSRRLWRSLVNSVLDLPVGVLIGAPTIALAGTVIVLTVAVPIAILAAIVLVLLTRFAGVVERNRARTLLDIEVTDPIPALPKGFWAKIRAIITSRERWKHLAYCLVRLPVSTVMFPIVVVPWAGSAVLATLPATVSLMPNDTAQFGIFGASQGVATVGLAVAGIIGLVVVAPWITMGAAHIDSTLIARLLGPKRESVLEARAEQAESGRVAAIDAAAAERRRIERDLHDGAQQRLVALAVDLGSARERMDTDPEGARALVAEAHDEAKAALKEIRDLVRGIYPAILDDRGLDASLSAVVARSPIPVELKVDRGLDLPDSIESAAYFVVSEALANVARHAGATKASVAVVRSGDHLIVEIRDNGAGGADPARGTGLRGLRDRVTSLGGTMDLLSPTGGPTTLLVELPCGS